MEFLQNAEVIYADSLWFETTYSSSVDVGEFLYRFVVLMLKNKITSWAESQLKHSAKQQFLKALFVSPTKGIGRFSYETN
jgi:archaellum biogenesis ATPase FlaH